MPIDETILDGVILDLISKINDNSLQRQTLRNIYNMAAEIKLIDVPDLTTEDKINRVVPNDPKLGTTITEERRQAIYDKVLADVELL